MDRFTRDIVNGRAGKGLSALLLLAFLLTGAGCFRGWHGGATPPPGPEKPAGDNTTPATVRDWLPPIAKTEDPGGKAVEPPPVDNTAPVTPKVEFPAASPPAEAVPPTAGPTPKAAEPPADGQGRPSAGAGREAPDLVAPALPRAEGERRGNGAPSTHKSKPAAVPHPVPTAPPKDARDASPPGWAKSPEELVYRVDFIGITMGYARFRYKGMVSIVGKSAYHLNVRAWTSGVLSYIYPINETIDYYLDTETLAPIRQEFTQRAKGKDDVAFYNQETGRITYRYRETGAIRKQVDTIPSVYDPVSVAYYFRWRDLGLENRPRNVYAGRKVYQISARVLGNERIHTERGEMDTIAVRPVIRRDGKPDDKGDLKIWFSRDERRVPVRLYAKFRKIKDWTLVGELMPRTAKAGG